MKCGNELTNTCSDIEQICSTINHNINLGEYTYRNVSISFTISDTHVSNYTHPSIKQDDSLWIPTVIKWNIQPNDVVFQVTIDSFSGGKVTQVLGVDVFAHLDGGRLTDNYCTVWSGQLIP